MRIKTIPDETILEWIQAGTLWMDYQNLDVWFRGKILKPTIVGKDSRNGTRLRVEIRFEGKKRTILRNRLAYMTDRRIVIPDGHEIHHLDLDRYNDHPDNLICLSLADHLRLHRYLSQPEESEDVPF